jgi:hypothetical protein
MASCHHPLVILYKKREFEHDSFDFGRPNMTICQKVDFAARNHSCSVLGSNQGPSTHKIDALKPTKLTEAQTYFVTGTLVFSIKARWILETSELAGLDE